MANVGFAGIAKGSTWTRADLAKRWGYESQEAITRGIVTPAEDKHIIIFITIDKDPDQPQYRDELRGRTLIMDGEKGHTADNRIVNAQTAGDEIHVFIRDVAREPFEYMGRAQLVHSELHDDEPSLFVLTLLT